MNKKKTTGTQQGIDRPFELIEMLSKNDIGMNISDISKALNITRVTATSIVQTLLQRNYLEKDEQGKYHIGYKFLELSYGYRFRYPFLYATENFVKAAAEKLNIRINISVLKSPGVAVVLLSKDASLLPKMILGYVFPAYASASGKLLLSLSSLSDIDDWISSMTFTPYTEYTIRDEASLRNELAAIQQEGISYEIEEMMLQRCCLAAPIRNFSGQVVASVSFSCNNDRFEREKSSLKEELLVLAKDISAALGFNSLTNG